jgi:hypothetical protein
MLYQVVIMNEAGNPFPGVTAGILPRNEAGYSLEDNGFWSTSGPDGLLNIYYPDTLDNKVLIAFSPDGRSVTQFWPAADYNGQIITLETAGRGFPWWLLVLAGVAGYIFLKKGR